MTSASTSTVEHTANKSTLRTPGKRPVSCGQLSFLDTSSQVNLITSKMANSLKATRIDAPCLIQGYKGQSSSQSAIQLTLHSLYHPETVGIKIRAQVVDEVQPYHFPDVLQISSSSSS